ncbi:ATP-binding protein [Flavobacterium qiangtangense]|uniref:ATP-binding protein n=1 Tax=Flavobacterium qiangtangense TaxID=1442595 RepID=A0ABW1PJ80_9FLAO
MRLELTLHWGFVGDKIVSSIKYGEKIVIEDRHKNGSIIVTSQIPVQGWYHIIGEKTIADAILDRLIHNAHRIELSGELHGHFELELAAHFKLESGGQFTVICSGATNPEHYCHRYMTLKMRKFLMLM